MSIKNLVEMIKRNGLLASMPQLEELYQVAIENELKLAESQREFRAADATIENLQMQVEKLAAENTGLKATAILLADEANQVYRRWNLIQQPDGDIVDMQTIHELLCACHETPATDAFLAEVRAQGVERLANAWYAIANETDPGISISDSSRLKYRQRADDAADFANEIRQEAAQ
ncbi:hypothetical protein NFK84_15515 [Enterobacter ludwigii]|uniref:hypothetical protein n=1 Tax=Enterobacter ludwigii TaxID=299767 RepID=UPI00242E03BB|nr:hypothetical protein [Enterobacter ludwigii]WGA03119.1 hypothetical protein NFK84_15515 [Enterobacter ludwigii]